MNQDFQDFEPRDYSKMNVKQGANEQVVLSRTFLYMFAVLTISAVTAYATATSDLGYRIIFDRSLFIGLLVVELACVFIGSFVMRKGIVSLSAIMLLAYSVVNGMTLSVIFYIYDLSSIVGIFAMSAILFGVMAVFGIVTKKDLTTIGQIGIMALFGIIIFGVGNLFMKNQSLDLGLSVLGLAIFIGLTAYDTQKIKNMAREYGDDQINTVAMFGALTLYLDFINIFLKLLRLFGSRK